MSSAEFEGFEIPEFFDLDDWREPIDAEKKYKNTTLGKWLLIRLEGGETVIPHITDAVPQGEGTHPVGWWQRIRPASKEAPALNQFQVVCGCVMDMSPTEIDQGHFSCHALDRFIDLGAQQARARSGLDSIIGYYGAVEPVDEDLLTRLDIEVTKKLLTDVTTNPAEFAGNRISASHWITGIALFLHKTKAEALQVTQSLQAKNLVELRPDETVILRTT